MPLETASAILISMLSAFVTLIRRQVLSICLESGLYSGKMDRGRKKDLEENAPLLLTRKSDKASEEDEEDQKTRNASKYAKEKTRLAISVWQLFRFASSEDKLFMFIGTVASIVHGAGMPILGVVFGSMANALLSSGPETGVELGEIPTASAKMAQYCYTYLGLGISTLIAAFVQTYCWEMAAASLVFKLRRQFFRQVLRQQINWFDENQAGELSLNLLDDLERFQEGVGQIFGVSIQYISSFVLGALVGLFTCWQLTLVVLALTPLLSIKAAVVGKYVVTKLAEEKERYAKAGCLSIETFSSNRTVAAFGGEQREIEKYKKALMDGLEFAKTRIYFQSFGIGFSYFTLFICQALAFWCGGKLLYDQVATAGHIITVLVSTMTGIFALGHAIPYFSVITIAQSAAERVYRVIDTIPNIDSYSTTGAFLDKVVGKIQFSQVYFSYPARYTMPVLKRLEFTVLPGQTIGLVGTSGSGKSTIVNILLRFYEPQSGEVLLDGTDINSLNLHWLRNQIGYVSQEPVLFSTTIYENIALGTTKEVSYQQVIDAAKMANVHEFIVSLPQGYNTEITGTKLSGGQKQRIAIARAIISNPKILLLDEATSALDGKSEAMVQIGLRKAMKGRTTIIIAHRLSTIREADCIYALKDGTIVESGSHEKLMEKEGLYYDLVMAQSPLESVEETDAYSIASTVESADDYSVTEFEYKQQQKRRRTISHRMSVSMEAMVADKAQLLKEVNELKLEVPSIFKILNKGAQWKMLSIGAIGAIIAGLVRPSHAYFYSEMLIVFITGGEHILASTEFLALIYVILAVGAAIGYFVDVLFISWAGEKLTSKLRLESFTSIIRQQISWYDEDSSSPARLSARLARDAPLVNMAAGERLGIALIAITTIVSSLTVAFYFGWRLASILFIAFPALGLSGYIQVTIQAGGQLRDSEFIENAGNLAIECIQSIRTVQALCQEEFFYRKYRECVEPVYLEAKRQGTYFGIALGLSATITYFVYAGSFWYGARLVDQGLMTQDNIYRVFFPISFCAVAVGHMTSFIPDFQKARLASALIFNLIELKSEIDPLSPLGQKPRLQGSIEFSDVVFSYPARPDTRVLQSLSFKVEPGQTLAVVGMSGSGKSTVVSLVERFYDVLSGAVLIDGVDIREINVAHLRKHMSLVQQEPVLFDTTIRENIAYGYVRQNVLDSDTPTEEAIIQSAKDANIHDFITKLPKGYDTLVGERAVQLSGGQKQRVAIARALIRNPRILLLDEATSALDTESEHVVQEALDRAREGRTCIIIAHRLSTIQNADIIAVVSNGRIIEMGTPEKLMAKKGIYYKITKKQRLQYT